MKINIEQILTGLVPALNGPLPPELVDLAFSLVARSQSVATSLKPDEEIARPYACCELACERLKKSLNLPAITSRPPCPPRTYKKLYAYLSSSLSQSQNRAPETPKKPKAHPGISPSGTPKTQQSGKKTPRSVAKQKESGHELPEWCMPTIRDICKEFSYSGAAPHVFVGLASVLPRFSAEPPETPSRKRSRRVAAGTPEHVHKTPDLRILSLIAVLLFYILSRMLDEEISPEQFLQWRNKAVSLLRKSKVGKDCGDADVLAEIEQLMPMAQEEGWLGMEWYTNISPTGETDNMEGVEMTGANVGQAKGRQNGPGGLKGEYGSSYIGLATMMQDAVDFLGERRREEYAIWKADILAGCDQIEASRIE